MARILSLEKKTLIVDTDPPALEEQKAQQWLFPIGTKVLEGWRSEDGETECYFFENGQVLIWQPNGFFSCERMFDDFQQALSKHFQALSYLQDQARDPVKEEEFAQMSRDVATLNHTYKYKVKPFLKK